MGQVCNEPSLACLLLSTFLFGAFTDKIARQDSHKGMQIITYAGPIVIQGVAERVVMKEGLQKASAMMKYYRGEMKAKGKDASSSSVFVGNQAVPSALEG